MVRFKKTNYLAGIVMAVTVAVHLFGFPSHGWGEDARAVHDGLSEEAAIHEAAKNYLDAEIKRDLPAVYALLAPSSAYRTAYDYAAFLAEANASPVRIVAYKILRIAHIRNNHDAEAFPRVEKFAQVEVDVVMYYGDTRQKGEVNFDFTFIKEGGKWYKG
ncbi:MAG: hypothetical protein PHN75_01445 [Syntrophales bacterium]|nr:hypothetical protein [Syntrophales bacterium]